MKAQKYKVSIEVESLSMDTLHGLLAEVVRNVEHEINSGNLMHDDGDTVKWETETKPVEF